MKFEADLHVHTVSSGHAYSTVTEIFQTAAQKGLKLIAITDHGPSMPGAPNPYYFGNLRALPDELEGVKLLRGVEANIIDFEGGLDLDDYYLNKLDIVAAGFHDHACTDGSMQKNTETLLKVMKSTLVDIIVHPGNPMFKIDYRKIVQAAGEYNVLLEINESSLSTSRTGSYSNCVEIASEAASQGVRVCMGSDAHWAGHIGRFDYAKELVAAAGLREKQIVNVCAQWVADFLKEKAKERFL